MSIFVALFIENHVAHYVNHLRFPFELRDLKDAFDAYLVLTFVGQTRVLGLDNEDELGEVDINGFDSNGQVNLQPSAMRIMRICRTNSFVSS